jgi:hypothetical protein
MILTPENFIFFVIRHYDNPGCLSKKELKLDLDRVKFLKRLFRRYLRKKTIDSLKVRLALNHIIILYNVFPGEAATKILFYKLEKELWCILKPFLIFLDRLPDRISGVYPKDIITTGIRMDNKIIDELRKI